MLVPTETDDVSAYAISSLEVQSQQGHVHTALYCNVLLILQYRLKILTCIGGAFFFFFLFVERLPERFTGYLVETKCLAWNPKDIVGTRTKYSP